MEYVQAHGAVTWSTFFWVAAWVVLIYTLLVLLRRRLERGLYLSDVDEPVRAFLRFFLLLIDPLALLILASVFVVIWPAVHGLILGLLILIGFPYVRDYTAGRVFQFDHSVQVGRKFETGGLQGTIAKLGLVSLYIQRDSGRSRVSYADVLRSGYTISGNLTLGGYFNLKIVLPKGDEKENAKTAADLRTVLLDSPFIHPEFRLEILPVAGDEQIVDLNVSVHRAEHLNHLVAQLFEAGYKASILSR